MMTVIARTNILIGLLLSPLLMFAQFENINVSEMANKYKNQKAVVLEYSEILRIKNSGGGLKIESTQVESLIHLDRKGVSVSSDEVSYDPHFFTVEKLEAATYNQLDGKWKKKEVKEFKDVQSMGEYSFFDSGRAIQFEYSDITTGSITAMQYTTSLKDYRSLGSFVFQLNLPIEKAFYQVELPKDVEVGIVKFGDFSNITYTTIEEGNTVIHRWEAKEIKESQSFKFSPSYTEYLPHLYVYIKSYQSKGKKIELQGTKELLYKTNYEFVKDLKTEASPEMKTVVDSLRKVSPSELDLVKNITYWVQDHIRYLAFEYGMGGFVPRNAEDVCERKFGDCKDMANLIKRMLDYAGVESHLCWIGTRSKGYTYDQLPLGYCDNHMIAAYKHNGEYIYLDATSKQQPFGYPSMGIQGKQVMIAIDADHFETPFVPVVDPSLNVVTDQVMASIEGRNLILNGKMAATGYVRANMNERLEANEKRNEKEVMLAILKRGSNKCLLDSYQAKNLSNRDSVLQVDYKLTIQDYVRELNGDLYVNMNFDDVIMDLKPDTAKRTIRAEYEFLWEDLSKYELMIPEDYSVKSKPNRVVIDQPKYTFDLNYELVDNKLMVTKRFVFRSIFIEVAEMSQWMKDLSKIQEAFQKTVQLTKKK